MDGSSVLWSLVSGPDNLSHPSYLWRDTFDCGHSVNVETAVPIDRTIRIGEFTVCFDCKSAGQAYVRERVLVEPLGRADDQETIDLLFHRGLLDP
jgi:hypothetical protein